MTPNDERIANIKRFAEHVSRKAVAPKERKFADDLLFLLDAFPAMREEMEKVKEWLERKENAKREVERQLEDCWIERKKAEAELEAARPLIEAAMVDPASIFDGTGPLVAAALALRQRKEKGE